MNRRYKCLVVGYGSIGKRHAILLESLGHEVSVVSSRPVAVHHRFIDIPSALKGCHYEYAVVCTQTSGHYDSMKMLLENGFSGTLLVEKPLFEKPGYDFSPGCNTFVAYNLRFHPILQRIRSIIDDRQIYSMHVYCGQYLPSWRQGRDYKKTYSALRSCGGGVLNDLSHELDYITWMMGKWNRVAATGGHVSTLAIDSDDLFCILLSMERCSGVTLQINYLDLIPRREIILNGENLAIKADLIKGTLSVGDSHEVFEISADHTYLEQHKSIFGKTGQSVCTYQEGYETVMLINAIERAAKKGIWIKRN